VIQESFRKLKHGTINRFIRVFENYPVTWSPWTWPLERRQFIREGFRELVDNLLM
jgi:hypothetical protein